MEIKELKNIENFSTNELNEVITDCDTKLSKMTAVDNIDELLMAQELAVSELQKRAIKENE